MKKIYTVLVLIIAVFVCHAQTTLEMADASFNNKDYTTALDLYQKVLKKGGKIKNAADIKFNVAESYRYTGKPTEALDWYEQAKAEGYSNPNYLFHEAGIMIKQGRYAEAKTKLQAFLEQQPNDKEATRMLNNCDFALAVNTEVTVYTIKNEATLNTVYSEYEAVPVKDKVIFTSSRIENKDDKVYQYDGQGFSDLFQTTYSKEDKSYTNATELTTLNSAYNDGEFTYCEATKTAYFTRCNGDKAKKDKANKDKVDYCVIDETTYNENAGTWSEPKPINLSFVPKGNMGQPSISSDGKQLYFASRMEGSTGGSDIWVTTYNGSQWGEPQNLGTTINTEFDEMFPVVFHDSILYFSSEGNIGYGGLDLFYSVKSNGTWGKPVNLKAPFNSSADDFAIVYNNDKSAGYFSSNRTGGAGSDDIYSFFLTPVNLTVKGRVTDVDGGNALANAMVILSSADGNDTTYTNSNGEYTFVLDKDKDYKINVISPGYFGDSRRLTTQGEKFSKEFSKANGNNYDFSIKKIPKTEIKIENIYYDYDSYNLRDESKPELDKLVKLLEDTPDANVQINSHTDERGKFDYNMKLSENRAKSVVDYLIEKGISPGRLSSKGFASSQPVVKNAKTEEEHQMNRRTTFQVLNNN